MASAKKTDMPENAAPPTLSPATVRAQVIEQHRGLRALLQQALEATTTSLQGSGPPAPVLAELIRELRARLLAHLGFEERWLVPVLAEADAWGPERVRDLVAEHIRQRAELDTLAEGIQTGWDIGRLALATRSLVTDLLCDMDEEERGCLSAELLRDDVVAIDQATD
jgi:hypothetical protein